MAVYMYALRVQVSAQWRVLIVLHEDIGEEVMTADRRDYSLRRSTDGDVT